MKKPAVITITLLSVSIIVALGITFYLQAKPPKEVIQLSSPLPTLVNRVSPPSPSVSPVAPSIPADWKTYRNDKLGLEIKYPPLLKLQFIPLGSSAPDENNPVFMSVSPYMDFGVDLLEMRGQYEALTTLPRLSPPDRKVRTTVAGRNAIKTWFDTPEGVGAISFYIDRGNDKTLVVTLSYYLRGQTVAGQTSPQEQNRIFEQMLSSIIFL